MMSKASKGFGGYGGPTLIQRIEKQMDKRRKTMEDILIQQGPVDMPKEYTLNQGRYEGLAAALAILRSSNITHEFERSNERLGIE